MKALKWIWIYSWAYLFIALEQIDKLGEWVGKQIDKNDYLAGFVFATMFVTIPWVLGIIDIVVK